MFLHRRQKFMSFKGKMNAKFNDVDSKVFWHHRNTFLPDSGGRTHYLQMHIPVLVHATHKCVSWRQASKLTNVYAFKYGLSKLFQKLHRHNTVEPRFSDLIRNHFFLEVVVSEGSLLDQSLSASIFLNSLFCLFLSVSMQYCLYKYWEKLWQ